MKYIFKNIVVSILTFESKLILKKYKPNIVAITGSVGKTSTKDAIFSIFSKNFYSRKSAKSFNSEIGIPLTILGCPNAYNNPLLWLRNFWEGLMLILITHNYPKWIILEVGADRPGDIEKISAWLSVDIVVFTTMSKVPSHVEFFNSPEDVINEKMKLLKSLKSDGFVIFNKDDEVIENNMSLIEKYKKVSYGFGKEAEIRGSYYKIIYGKGNGENHLQRPLGINFKVNHINSSVPVNLKGTLGKHYIYSILAGISTSLSIGINLVDSSSAVEDFVPPPGRMRIIEGVKNSIIIDDSYNSSPIALSEALGVLNHIKTSGRKIVVLGDMLELGKHSMEEHKKIGSLLPAFAEYLFTVGIRAKFFAESAINAGFLEDKVFQFDVSEARDAGKRLELLLQEGDVVLIKGSQAIRLEKAVEEVMADPIKKEELLVRQEKEWQNK